MKYKTSKGISFRGLQEWHRTVILFVLLGIGTGVMIWTNTNVSNNFVDQFQELPEPQPIAEVVVPEAVLEPFVRGQFVINGRIDGFEDRFNNISFSVNANSDTDYSISELPDSGDQTIYVVNNDNLYTRSGTADWDTPTKLEGDLTGYGATRFTPTNQEVNDAWKLTQLQPNSVACNTGQCAEWSGEADDGAITELLISQEGQIVKLYNKSATGVEVTFDYSYNALPTVEPFPRGLVN